MSNPIKDGGPAFPTTPTGESVGGVMGGMSLRDYFAGQALAGWCSTSVSINGAPMNMTRTHGDEIASGCYRYADAMLAAREAKP